MKNNNNDFILSSVSDILINLVTASSGIGNGIETFPLCDYIMQSVFLRMTGHQEQKMKSICWELASNDYDYRYEFNKASLGECSTYKDKQSVYKDLIMEIKKVSPNFKISTDINRGAILKATSDEVKTIFNNSSLATWLQKSFNDYLMIWNFIGSKYFAGDETNLFAAVNNETSLKTIYEEHLYKQRNRIAHNTISYQHNLPTLKTLICDNYKYQNYFLYFSIIILIDKIFIELYKFYINSLDL